MTLTHTHTHTHTLPLILTLTLTLIPNPNPNPNLYGLQPLDDPTRAKSSRLGAPTSLYRCISETDGKGV